MDYLNTNVARTLRWLLTLGWTGFVLMLMLTPGEETLAADLSAAGGGSDFTDGIGHVVLFSSVVVLWWQAVTPSRWALWVAVGVGLAAGLGTEYAQQWVPNRGVRFGDYLANVLGVLVAVGVIHQIKQWRDT